MEKTEITYEVFDSLGKIKSKLVKNGFILTKSFILNDWYFSKFPLSKLRNFSYKKLINSSFLVRDICKNNEHSCCIQYKIKNINKSGEVVSEEKLTLNIDDVELAKEIFKKCSLTNWCNITNYSYVYCKEDIEVVVQDCGTLGVFIEIEEPDNSSYGDLSPEKKVKKLKEIALSLGLSLGNDSSCKKPFIYLRQNV